MNVYFLCRCASVRVALCCLVAASSVTYRTIAYGAGCNLQQAEDPAPKCGPTKVPCGDISWAACNPFPWCPDNAIFGVASQTEHANARVPKDCEETSEVRVKCQWSEADTICYTIHPCGMSHPLYYDLVCLPVGDCGSVEDSFRETVSCD